MWCAVGDLPARLSFRALLSRPRSPLLLATSCQRGLGSQRSLPATCCVQSRKRPGRSPSHLREGDGPCWQSPVCPGEEAPEHRASRPRSAGAPAHLFISLASKCVPKKNKIKKRKLSLPALPALGPSPRSSASESKRSFGGVLKSEPGPGDTAALRAERAEASL